MTAVLTAAGQNPGSDSTITSTVVAFADTAGTLQNRWMVVRVNQDTTTFSDSTNTTADSILVDFEWSDDGVNWTGVDGTPTREYAAAPWASGSGEQANPLFGGEGSPGLDGAEVELQCYPSLYSSPTAVISNRTLCALGATFVRFIISIQGAGQFKAEVGHWK
jgi:hypothetical protein